MYGLDLTRSLASELSALLYKQAQRIESGQVWDDALWQHVMDIAAKLKARFDLPDGYDNPFDPFANECGTCYRRQIDRLLETRERLRDAQPPSCLVVSAPVLYAERLTVLLTSITNVQLGSGERGNWYAEPRSVPGQFDLTNDPFADFESHDVRMSVVACDWSRAVHARDLYAEAAAAPPGGVYVLSRGQAAPPAPRISIKAAVLLDYLAAAAAHVKGASQPSLEGLAA